MERQRYDAPNREHYNAPNATYISAKLLNNHSYIIKYAVRSYVNNAGHIYTIF